MAEDDYQDYRQREYFAYQEEWRVKQIEEQDEYEQERDDDDRQ